MSKTPEEHRKDPGYKQAKRKGYRARSAFKLFEIQKRFNVFKRVFYVLDIGSTPGSWLQVAKKFTEENLQKYKDDFFHRDHYKIMGVDLKKIPPLEDVMLIKMDATSPEFEQEVKQYFQSQVDLILCDASIKKSGNKFSDQARQFGLCYKLLELAKNVLKYKGAMVIKVFQGADYDSFFKKMRKQFITLRSYKPQASNKKSNEIYLIGLKKK